MKTIIINIISLLLLFCINLSAQSDTKADKIYDQLGYKEAIQLYRAGKLTMAKMERIANGYRLNHDTQNAEKWYAQIAEESGNPLNLLYYAQALHSNGNLEKAKEYYLKYDAKTGGGSDTRGQLRAYAIDRISNFKNNETIEVNSVSTINSSKLDFSPVFYKDGVVFVSNRTPGGAMKKGFSEKDLWTGDDYNTHYFARQKADGTLADPQIFSLSLDGKFHEGPLTFSKSGDQVFFTRNISKKKKSKEFNLQIFTAFQNGADFELPEKIDLGNGSSNDAHPALSPGGGHLYFASDRSGGYGGMDIWVSSFSGGKWMSPENLGPKINTAGNEVFPFIYEDGTLYFASDGWGGLGGLDIFYAEKGDEINWGEAKNIGIPINSNKDDFSYVLNELGTEGYFTSARGGGSGQDDIYHFKLPKPQGNKDNERKVMVEICTFDEVDSHKLADVKVNVLVEAGDGSFQGIEDDFIVKLIPTAVEGEYAISFKKRDPFGDIGEGNETYMTNKEGYFNLEVKPGRKYIFISKLEGYHESRQEFLAEDLINSNGEFCIPLTPAECMSLYGTVSNRRYGNKVPKATVTLIDLCSGEMLSTMTDDEGFYEFPCIPCGCDFIIRGEKTNFKEDNGLASTVDYECIAGEAISTDLRLNPVFNADGTKVIVNYTEDPEPKDIFTNVSPLDKGPVEVNPDGELPKNAEELLSNGLTIELRDIYYDFDQFYIRTPDADSDLDKLIKVMTRNPSLFVELGSHTDSRGTDEYNMDLSARRAEAAVAYIVERGIDASRIVARGYGETDLVNECSDGVDCSERDHQLNRRTEVKIFRK